MSGRSRKKTGGSLPLPFEEYPAPSAPLPNAAASSPSRLPRTSLNTAVSSPHEAHPACPENWNQLALWIEEAPPDPFPTDPSPTPDAPPPPASIPPPSPPPAGTSAPTDAPAASPPPPPPASEADGRPNRTRTTARPSSSRPVSLLPDDAGVEAAAEALGLNLEELRAAAQEMDLSAFRSFLRAHASARLRRLREAPANDPFEWDAPALSAVPAFVEDRVAVELLYRSLRGGDPLDLWTDL